MAYRDTQKRRQERLKPLLWKLDSTEQGDYIRGKQGENYLFCLPEARADENLFPAFRSGALHYFRERNIGWHDAINSGSPGTHLCCSQVSCVNTWYGYCNQPEKLKRVLLNLGYDVSELLPFTLDVIANGPEPGYVAFEWIGSRNYLQELLRGRVAPDNGRTRGASFTSSDFAFRFRRSNGTVQIVLGEWKYTENYTRGASKVISRSGTDRLENVYRRFLEKPDCPIQLQGKAEFTDLFFDPFDQMMRLQLLAAEMERAGEMDADEVTLLHVSPEANKEFNNRVTSNNLAVFGSTVYDIWEAIVKKPKFKHIFTGGLFGSMLLPECSCSGEWAEYIAARYR